jgi:hypothetical protein
MVNLRKQAELDLGQTLEGEFSLPVFLTDPDGVKYTLATSGDPLVGQILYDKIKIDPETGEEIAVKNPIVSLRRSSLTRIPQAGEVWQVQIPITPDPDAAKVSFILGKARGPEGGASIGFIRLYLQEAEQS